MGTSDKKLPAQLKSLFPIFEWSKSYDKDMAINDGVAALIVTIMLIPQSLAYALLAGLPAEIGIYASIIPIILYSIFGTSHTLAVGPVAIVSLMTAAAIGNIAEQGSLDYITAALTLAFLSGLILILMGLFRLGFIANFLSHPVISGFITASGIIIAVSQVKHILGVDANGHTLYEILSSIITHISKTNFVTLAIGLFSLFFLFWVRKGLKPLLLKTGLKNKPADIISKAGPIAAVAITTIIAWGFNLKTHNVSLVGDVPQSLPPLTTPSFSIELWSSLLGSALLISIIGFVESISVAQTLAAKKHQRINPDQELIGLGAANMGAAFSGGYPVTGGFARSVVNFNAGAETPAAGAFTAIGLAMASLLLTPFIYFLPQATLAATIIVAVLGLIDVSILKRTWAYSKADFIAVSSTIGITLLFGVEIGVSTGVILSILIHLYKTSRPHIAIVGQVPGTEHFRNIDRHKVITQNNILTLRIDESLYFANAKFLEDQLYNIVTAHPNLEHVILMCPGVNNIDMSALNSLEVINKRLNDVNAKFHLSEIKGPVMDKLHSTQFLKHLTGQIYLSQHEAICDLTKCNAPHLQKN